MDHPFGIILACLRRLEDGASDVPPTPHDDLGAAAGSSCLTAAGPLPLHGEARMGGHTLDDARLLSFDIEISDVFDLDPGEDMERYAPFHISVAATAVPGGEERHWLSVDEAGEPALNLTRRRAHELLEYLAEKLDEGFALCAWNGLHFDMQWIGHHAGDMALAAEIALEIYDPMFQFFNDQGVPGRPRKCGGRFRHRPEEADERGGCTEGVARRPVRLGEALRPRRLPDHPSGRSGDPRCRPHSMGESKRRAEIEVDEATDDGRGRHRGARPGSVVDGPTAAEGELSPMGRRSPVGDATRAGVLRSVRSGGVPVARDTAGRDRRRVTGWRFDGDRGGPFRCCR